jgi:hypothetical protein
MNSEDSRLRRQAEKTASKEDLHLPESLEAMTLAESRLALHELHIHQIELEMQNEELRRAQASSTLRVRDILTCMSWPRWGIVSYPKAGRSWKPT